MHKFAWVLAVFSPLVISPSIAVAAMPDWWLIFGSGDQPKREVLYADALSVAETPSKSAAEPTRSVDVVHVFEEQDKPLFMLYRIAFQCKSGNYIIEAADAKMRSGEVTQGQTTNQWQPVARSMLERPYDFVCKASARRANGMIKIARPELANTLPEFTYRAFWGPAVDAPSP
ncbi:hypothetical protein [Pseudomonas sp. nanlin1]|uniref:hypothetical protein n=1 Tax=Pseudomonas sp. nanlin1 TaxID=3040605 RepID=UPI00388F75D5